MLFNLIDNVLEIRSRKRKRKRGDLSEEVLHESSTLASIVESLCRSLPRDVDDNELKPQIETNYCTKDNPFLPRVIESRCQMFRVFLCDDLLGMWKICQYRRLIGLILF